MSDSEQIEKFEIRHDLTPTDAGEYSDSILAPVCIERAQEFRSARQCCAENCFVSWIAQQIGRDGARRGGKSRTDVADTRRCRVGRGQSASGALDRSESVRALRGYKKR